MANTIKNFLVGVGLDTKEFDKGSKGVLTNLGRMRGLVGLIGAGMTTAMIAVGAASVQAGERLDKLSLSTERMSSSTAFVTNFGNAIRLMGGEASDAVQAVNSFESAIDKLRQGEYPFEALNIAGIDTSALASAQTGADIARTLSVMVPELDPMQQRAIQDSFGISDATMRLLRQGEREFDAIISHTGSIAGNIEAATVAARDYNRALSETQLRFQGIGNSLAEKTLPAFTKILSSFNSFIDNNEKGIEKATDIIAENPGTTAAVIGGLGAAATGGVASAIGMKTAGGLLVRTGLPGAAIGASVLADEAIIPEDAGPVIKNAPKNFMLAPLYAAEEAIRLYAKSRNGYEVNDFLPENNYEQSFEYAQAQDVDSSGTYGYITEGAVTNTEAAQASPEIIMLNNQQNQPVPRPQQQKIQNNLEIKLEMDGRSVETKVIDVLERRDQATIDDMQSTTVR